MLRLLLTALLGGTSNEPGCNHATRINIIQPACVVELDPAETPSIDGALASHASSGSATAACHLPPADPRFSGREADVSHLVRMILPGASIPSPTGNATAKDSTPPRDSAFTACGPGVKDAEAMGQAVCIVAGPGYGKSALAVTAGWRLWEHGACAGGVWLVDLQGVDSRAELVSELDCGCAPDVECTWR